MKEKNAALFVLDAYFSFFILMRQEDEALCVHTRLRSAHLRIALYFDVTKPILILRVEIEWYSFVLIKQKHAALFAHCPLF